MAMGVEFELKFRATPEQLDKVEQGISGERQVIEMETTYYDTPDGALSQRKYTLRRRMENGVSVCTLKTPVVEGNGFLATLEMTEEETIPSGERWERRRGRIQRPERVAAVSRCQGAPSTQADAGHRNRTGKERIDTHHARGVTGDSPEEWNAEGSVPYTRNDTPGRREFEVNCDSIEKAIPELCKLSGVGLTALTAGGVAPVCGARFTRVASTLELPECTVELALDRGVLLGGGREIPLYEMEVELKSGSREAAALYAMALAQTYGMKSEKHSKFRRALDLARGE